MENIQNLRSNISGKPFDAYTFVSPDNHYLIFESYRPKGYGNCDLYISFNNKNSIWAKPENIGDKINLKEGGETFPSLSQDGKYFFFSRDRKGIPDVYRIDAVIFKTLKMI